MGNINAIEIPLSTSAMNVAEASMSETYPETGFTLNRKSEMAVRVIEGLMTLEYPNESHELRAGDVVLVPTDKPYRWNPHGLAKLYIVSTPPWTPEQAERVPG